MGPIINVSNSIEEDTKERIVLGTKAYYANLKFFKSRLVKRQSTLKLYRTVIRPIVTYTIRNMGTERSNNSEIISLWEENLKKNIWSHKRKGVKTNTQLEELIKQKKIINYIKAQWLSWFGHMQRMPDNRTVKKIFQWKPLTKRSQGRHKYRWKDNIKQDICQMKIKNWIAGVQDRGKWKDVVEKAKTFN